MQCLGSGDGRSRTIAWRRRPGHRRECRHAPPLGARRQAANDARRREPAPRSEPRDRAAGPPAEASPRRGHPLGPQPLSRRGPLGRDRRGDGARRDRGGTAPDHRGRHPRRGRGAGARPRRAGHRRGKGDLGDGGERGDMRIVALVVAGAALALVACGDDDVGDATTARGGEKPPLVRSAAASMTEALEECGPEFEHATVRLQFAGSDELAAQIRQGVKPDVYAAANTTLPDELNEEGLLSEPVEFATNTFVLAVPKESEIRSIDGLTGDDVKIAIGAEDVPIGSYTRETLAQLRAEQERAI